MSGLSEALDEVGESGGDWSADIDFSGTDENIPVGWYPVRVKAAKKGPSAAGLPKVALSCEIQEGPFKGRYLYIHLSLTEKALWKTRKHLRNMGIAVDADGSFRLSPGLFIDREFDGEVTEGSLQYGSIENIRESEAGSLDDL